MTHRQAIRARRELLNRLPVPREVLRGSLIERTVRHSSGCPKCARGEGHPLSVLTVSYPGGRTRQFSLRPEQVPMVRQWLENYHRVKETLEEICEINQHFLRPDAAAPAGRRKSRG